jgi:hypothetical protein
VRTRLILAAVCILTHSLWFSTSPGDKVASSAPFVTVAYAGHTTGGDWCESGTPGCINGTSQYSGGIRASALPNQQNDAGTGVLVLALAFFLWTRLRA